MFHTTVLSQLLQLNGGVTLVRKYKILSIPKILFTVPYLDYQLTTTDLAPQLRKLPRACNENNTFIRLGRLRSGHAVLCPFFQLRYSTVLDEKSKNLSIFIQMCSTELLLCYSHRNRNLLSTSLYLSLMPTHSFQHKICQALISA